jgi:replicative DNA helicase
MTGNDFDYDAEVALLGALVVSPDAWDHIADVSRPNHFATDDHRDIAAALWALNAAKRPVDTVTLRAELKERGAYGASIAESLHEIVSYSDGYSTNARTYAERLRELYLRREIKRVARDALGDNEGTAVEQLERVSRSLSQLDAGTVSVARAVGELFDDLHKRLSEERNQSVDDSTSIMPTGLVELDALIGGVRPGVLAVFGARPSVGKSSIAIAIADNLARRGIPVGVFWLEDDASDFVRRLVARCGWIRTPLLRHGSQLRDEHWRGLESIRGSVTSLPIYVDDAHGLTAQEIAIRMRRMTRKHGVRVFIADHLGEMRIEREDRWGDRHDLALGRAARIYRDTAKDLGAAPLLFVQLNRQIERRSDTTPKLADIDGSGQIEQAARVVGFLSRGATSFNGEGDLTIDVVKNSTGAIGAAHVRWYEGYSTVGDRP